MSATAEAVRERPILFSGPMVRAILDGRKTQTRRVVTDHTSEGNFKASELRLDDAWVDGSKLKAYLDPAVAKRLGHAPDDIIERLYCRWWPDDLLWVRETFFDHGNFPGGLAATREERIEYRVDEWDRKDGDDAGPWTPSIHMPRWASRLTLRVTDVRAERVQDISEADAVAEGVERHDDDGATYYGPYGQGHASAVFEFHRVWDALNAKRGYGWNVNPYVW